MNTHETTIEIEGDDIDVVLHGTYIPRTVCNEHDGYCEYEGDEVEDMTVECNGIDITGAIPDDTLERLNREFSKQCAKEQAPTKELFRSMFGHYFHLRGDK